MNIKHIHLPCARCLTNAGGHDIYKSLLHCSHVNRYECHVRLTNWDWSHSQYASLARPWPHPCDVLSTGVHNTLFSHIYLGRGGVFLLLDICIFSWSMINCTFCSFACLRPLAYWDRGFESHRGHGYLSVVSVVYCQVEVSATSWSLVQRSPTACGASLCVI